MSSGGGGLRLRLAALLMKGLEAHSGAGGGRERVKHRRSDV